MLRLSLTDCELSTKGETMARKGMKIGDQFADGDLIYKVTKVIEDGSYEAEFVDMVPADINEDDNSSEYARLTAEVENAKKALDDQREEFHVLVKTLPLEKMNKSQLSDIALAFGIPVTEEESATDMIAAIMGTKGE